MDKIAINIGDEIYVNGKWFWDVINVTPEFITVKMYYTKEYPGLTTPNSTNIKIPADGITVHNKNNGIKYCLIGETLLKKLTGGLFKSLKVQSDISDVLESANKGDEEELKYDFKDEIFENEIKSSTILHTSLKDFKKVINEEGGAYATCTGTPGMGAMADFGGGTFSDTAVKLQNAPSTPTVPSFIKKRKKKNVTKTGNVIKESTTDDFKSKLFAFLEYPWQEDIEIDVIKLLSQYKDKFVTKNVEQIQAYLRNLMTTNDFDNKVFIQSTDSFADEYKDLAGVEA